MRHVRSAIVALVCVMAAPLCLGQQLSKKTSNQDVIDMVSLGLSDDVVIDKIHGGGETDFDTSIAGLKALKAAKVSDAVIRVMINPHPAPAVSAVPAVSPANNASGGSQGAGGYNLAQEGVKGMEGGDDGWEK